MLLQYKTKIDSKICTGKFLFQVLKTTSASDKAISDVTRFAVGSVFTRAVSQTMLQIVIPALNFAYKG